MTFAILPIALYAFTSCSLFRDFASITNENYIFGTIRAKNFSDFDCYPTMGLSVKTNGTKKNALFLLESKKTISVLKQTILENPESSGITFSLWFTTPPSAASSESPSVPKTSDQQYPILTIGAKERENDVIGGSGCPGYSFQIAEYQNHILLSYTDNDPALSCRFLVVRDFDFSPSALTHIAVGFDGYDNTTNVYINGQPIVLGAPNYMDAASSLSHWDSNNTLQFFANHQSNQYFHGSLHQFEVYEEYLNEAQVSELVYEGLMNIEPRFEEINLMADEDMELASIRQDSMEPLTVKLASLNSSNILLQLAVEVLALPENGLLTLANGNQSSTVAAKDRILIPMGQNSILINYTLKSTEFFNTPSTNGNGMGLNVSDEAIHFRIVALDSNSSEIIAFSEETSQNIHVLHVNHPPKILVPAEAVLDSLEPLYASVTGINVSDPMDYNIDRVRIDVTAPTGHLTLNSAYVSQADFQSCRKRSYSSAWQCVGDGISDRTMTFIAFPDDITFILRNLAYKSLVPGTEGSIVIKIYDGVGGMCLDEEEHIRYDDNKGSTFKTIHDECNVQEATIRVPGYDTKRSGSNNRDRNDDSAFRQVAGAGYYFGLANILFWALVIFVLTMVFCCCHKCYRCCAKGRKIIPYNFDEEKQTEDKSNE